MSPLANMVLTPLFPAVLVVGAIGLAIAGALPAAAGTVLLPLGLLLEAAGAVAAICADLPGSAVPVRGFTTMHALLVYLVIGVTVLGRWPGRLPVTATILHVPVPLMVRPAPILALAPAALLLLAAVWMTVSIYVSRHRIWPARHVPPEAVAATSLDYYLKQLVDRRDHLKREWLWHGPLLLACLLFFLIIFENQLPTPERLMKTLPFIVLLVVWVAAWAWQRWKMARQIQQEIDELKQP